MESQKPPVGPGASGILAVAAGLGLTVAALSTWVSMIRLGRAPEGWISFPALSSPLAVISVLAGGAFLGLWYGVLHPLRRRSFAAVVGLAVGLVSTFLLAALLGGWENPYAPPPLLPLLGSTALGAVTGSVVARRVRKLGWRTAPITLANLPLFLAGVFIWLWSRSYEQPALPAILLLATLFLIARSIAKSRDPRRATAALVALQAILVVVGVWGVITRSPTVRAEATGAPSTLEPRYIFLIVVDTLRRDSLSIYNPEARPTPHLDALAHDSVVFDSAYSPAPWTLPAVTSIMTGLPVGVHGRNSREPGDLGTLPTLASKLRDAGYHTAAFVENPFLPVGWGLDRGFAEYTAFPQPSFGTGAGPYLLAKSFPLKYKDLVGTAALTDLAIDWLADTDESSFFLWVHYFDPHAPYSPPSRHLRNRNGIQYFNPYQEKIREGTIVSAKERRRIEELYLAEVQYVDENVGRLLEAVKERGLYDDALIVLTSDHGEEFWEHGDFEHGHSVYNELISVPLLIKPPRSDAAGIYRNPVSVADLSSTILGLAGVTEGNGCLPAASLTEAVDSRSQSAEKTPIVSEGTIYDETQSAVIFEGYKWILYHESGREELFDLTEDPDEQRPLQRERPELLERARALYRERRQSYERVRSCLGYEKSTQEPMQQEQIERLRSLGYL